MLSVLVPPMYGSQVVKCIMKTMHCFEEQKINESKCEERMHRNEKREKEREWKVRNYVLDLKSIHASAFQQYMDYFARASKMYVCVCVVCSFETYNI